jgi:hypothetical protein
MIQLSAANDDDLDPGAGGWLQYRLARGEKA